MEESEEKKVGEQEKKSGGQVRGVRGDKHCVVGGSDRRKITGLSPLTLLTAECVHVCACVRLFYMITFEIKSVFKASILQPHCSSSTFTCLFMLLI